LFKEISREKLEEKIYVMKSFYGVPVKRVEFGFKFFCVLSYENELYYILGSVLEDYIQNNIQI